MNKKTAVEWLHETFVNATQTELKDNINLFFKQAKEMEKEQIISANADHCYPTFEIARLDAEEYYNNTFK